MTTENRTPETVRAELRTAEERLRIFERLVATLENDQLLLGASITMDTLAAAIPELAAMGENGDRRAEQAAEEAVEVLSSLRPSLEKFVEKRRGVSFILRRGLVPSLQNRRYALQQRLAALESVEPEAVGLFERVVQAAQNALSFGHPA